MNRNDTEFMVQKIRTQYMEKDSSQKDLDMLRELDAEVKRPANIFGYTFGSIGAIIMGAGMSLVMTDIGSTLGMENTMPVGIVTGVIGMLMAVVNYPIYKNILASRREKYADRILKLSERIMNKEGN
ncbi:MAG: dihydropteridine reductase [Ruminiclostridium sp.]|nr:dihydropteridine reductase [Ruminiclostridium sp.]